MSGETNLTANELLTKLYPNNRIEIRRTLPVGVDMVSGAEVTHFHISGNGLSGTRQAMIKIAKRIGDKERAGTTLLNEFLPLPRALDPSGSDFYIAEKVIGPTVDQIIRHTNGQDGDGRKHFLDTLGHHFEMWRRTLAQPGTKQPVGYVRKLQATLDLIPTFTLYQRSLAEIQDYSIILNGTQLPSLRKSLDRMSHLITAPSYTVLSHGDEGSCNAIVANQGDITFVDNGNAGTRIFGEPIAKTLMWFPATLSNHQKIDIEINDDQKVIIIDYAVVFEESIHAIIQEAKQNIFDEFSKVIDREQFYACIMAYLLREMQWTPSRNRELMLGSIFAMAMEAAGVMWGTLEDIPALTAKE